MQPIYRNLNVWRIYIQAVAKVIVHSHRFHIVLFAQQFETQRKIKS